MDGIVIIKKGRIPNDNNISYMQLMWQFNKGMMTKERSIKDQFNTAKRYTSSLQ